MAATTTDLDANVPLRAPARSDWLSIPRVSWAGVFAGVVVVLVVHLMLGVLGLGIGASTIDPLRERNPIEGLSIGAGIWFIATLLIAQFAGGFVSGRLAGVVRHMDGALHGIVAWGLSTLIAAYLVTSTVGGIIGGVGSAVGTGVKSMGSGMAAAASGQQSSGAGQNMMDLAQRLQKSGGTLSGPDREAAVNDVMKTTGKNRDDAMQIVTSAESTYRDVGQNVDRMKGEAGQKAREVGDRAAHGVAIASLWTFFALLLGGAVAMLGGRIGADRARLLVRRYATTPVP